MLSKTELQIKWVQSQQKYIPRKIENKHTLEITHVLPENKF